MKKSFAVLGLGRVGRSIAMELYELGADVLGIDNDEEQRNKVANHVTYAVNADICDVECLRNAGVSNMDAVVVAIGDCLEPSIMAVMGAKELGVPLVIANARDEITGEILSKVGADQILYPEKENGVRNAKKLMSSDFLEFFELSENVSLVEILPKKEWIGKTLKDLNLRKEYRINVIAMKRENDINVIFDPDEPLKENNPLIVIVKNEDLKRLM